ncbi:putative secreted protein, partial [Listeria marthii FSL S4-120]
GNQFERIINIGETAGTIKPSIPDNGGKPTNYIRILTDKAGNLITAYPIPKP